MCRIPIADIRSSPCKIHAKGINVIVKLQGANVFMFSKSELFSQVFLKDIGLRYRKLITQNITFADQLSWNTFYSWCIRFIGISFLLNSFTLSQISFLKMFTLQTTIAYSFCDHCYSRWLCSLCEDLISSNIIVNVVWQNYFLTSTGVYLQPLISKYEHTLEINTFILVNLISHRKICKIRIHS